MGFIQIHRIPLQATIRKVLWGLCGVLYLSPISAQVPLIFDTDFGGDADDLGALAMLNHFQNKGEVDLLAVMCWNREKYAVPAIDATNTFYGNPDIPIGVRKGEIHETKWNHGKVIADQLPHDATFTTVPEATGLYRKLLAAHADNSVVIVTVGPLMNIKQLIDSEPDAHSDMGGLDLVHAKVKEFVIMGGHFPSSKDEWNFNGDMPGITQYVLEKLALPITFSGAELGSVLKTGEVFNVLPEDSPLYLGFFHFSKHAPWMKQLFKGQIVDNSTFDQTAVLYAVRGGIGHYWHKVTDGRCVADAHGGNVWVPGKESNHAYLVLDRPKAKMEREMEAFMLGKFE
ncbi:MAG: nucleoside hydrolase [Bacteroidota bacterium]